MAGVGNAQGGQLPSKPQDPKIVLVDLVREPPIAPQIVSQAPPVHVQDPQGGVPLRNSSKMDQKYSRVNLFGEGRSLNTQHA